MTEYDSREVQKVKLFALPCYCRGRPMLPACRSLRELRRCNHARRYTVIAAIVNISTSKDSEARIAQIAAVQSSVSVVSVICGHTSGLSSGTRTCAERKVGIRTRLSLTFLRRHSIRRWHHQLIRAPNWPFREALALALCIHVDSGIAKGPAKIMRRCHFAILNCPPL